MVRLVMSVRYLSIEYERLHASCTLNLEYLDLVAAPLDVCYIVREIRSGVHRRIKANNGFSICLKQAVIRQINGNPYIDYWRVGGSG